MATATKHDGLTRPTNGTTSGLRWAMYMTDERLYWLSDVGALTLRVDFIEDHSQFTIPCDSDIEHAKWHEADASIWRDGECIESVRLLELDQAFVWAEERCVDAYQDEWRKAITPVAVESARETAAGDLRHATVTATIVDNQTGESWEGRQTVIPERLPDSAALPRLAELLAYNVAQRAVENCPRLMGQWAPKIETGPLSKSC